jgi:hypothetical protein
MVLWLFVIAAIAAWGVATALQSRQQLDRWPLPWPFALAVILASTPVLFAMERGNCDILVLALTMLGLLALRRKTWQADLLAAALFAIGAWIKLYPGLLLLPLLALRRYRAAAFFTLSGILLYLLTFPFMQQWLEVFHHELGNYKIYFHTSAHGLAGVWEYIFTHTVFSFMLHLPPQLGAALVMLPVALAGSVAVWFCPARQRLAFPLFLFILATATFVPAVSNDYNFFYLPLAAVALWDKRDPLPVHILMAYYALAWQPVKLPIGPDLLLLFKFLGLLGVGLALIHNAWRLRATPGLTQTQTPWETSRASVAPHPSPSYEINTAAAR